MNSRNILISIYCMVVIAATLHFTACNGHVPLGSGWPEDRPEFAKRNLSDIVGHWRTEIVQFSENPYSDSLTVQIDSSGFLAGYNHTTSCTCSVSLRGDEGWDEYYFVGEGVFDSATMRWKLHFTGYPDTLHAEIRQPDGLGLRHRFHLWRQHP